MQNKYLDKMRFISPCLWKDSYVWKKVVLRFQPPKKNKRTKKKKQEFWKVFDGQGFADWKISLAINSYDLEEDLVTFKH